MKPGDNTFAFDKAEDSPGFLLWQVTAGWQRGIKKALEPFDLTHAQFVLLASAHWLSLKGRDVTQVMLSDHSRIDPMTTSQVLRTLVAKGFIARAAHKTDTRAKVVVPTEAGKKLVKQAVIAVEKFDRDFFAALKSGLPDFNRKLQVLLTPANFV